MTLDAAPAPMPRLLVATGATLSCHLVDRRDGALARQSAIELPEMIQFVWPRGDGRTLYVACSDGSPGQPGSRHRVLPLFFDDAGFTGLGDAVALPSRPIHLCCDERAERLYVAYNVAPGATALALERDGRIGPVLAQGLPEGAHFAHQVVPVPGTEAVAVTCRGTDAKGDRPEEPGSIRLMRVEDGELRQLACLAPEGGFGFGPRNIAFDRSGRRFYAVDERRMKLHTVDVAADWQMRLIDTQPSALGDSPYRPRLAGSIAMHPVSDRVYISNRTHHTFQDDRQADAGPSGSTLVAWQPGVDAPEALQEVDSGGVHPRAFGIEPQGHLLAVGNIGRCTFFGPDGDRRVEPTLAVFAIDAEGRLAMLSNTPMPAERGLAFWVDFLRPATGHIPE